MADLFGGDIKPPVKNTKQKKPKGNPMVIAHGKGPKGVKCKHCVHRIMKKLANNYSKCRLNHPEKGSTTDIKANWDACSKFYENDEFWSEHVSWPIGFDLAEAGWDIPTTHSYKPMNYLKWNEKWESKEDGSPCPTKDQLIEALNDGEEYFFVDVNFIAEKWIRLATDKKKG